MASGECTLRVVFVPIVSNVEHCATELPGIRVWYSYMKLVGDIGKEENNDNEVLLVATT